MIRPDAITNLMSSVGRVASGVRDAMIRVFCPVTAGHYQPNVANRDRLDRLERLASKANQGRAVSRRRKSLIG
jgi:hypothetical protein